MATTHHNGPVDSVNGYKVNGTSVVDASRNVTGVGGAFTGAVSGTTGAFTGALTTTGGVASGTALKVGGIASALAAAGTAVTNSTTETVSASVTVPANTIGLGSVVRVWVSGIATATNSTDTLTVRLRIGGTTLTGTAVIAGAAVDVANNSFFVAEFRLVGRAAAGAAAACVGAGWLSNVGTTSAGTNPIAVILASTNFATNAALLVEATLQWSVANAGNIANVEMLNVEIVV